MKENTLIFLNIECNLYILNQYYFQSGWFIAG
jgi:hypothetical protein